MTVQEFITFIQGLVQLLGIVGLVIGASATAAYILFKRYGERWIESKFESQLASYKHEQQKELEKVRFNINALLDRPNHKTSSTRIRHTSRGMGKNHRCLFQNSRIYIFYPVLPRYRPNVKCTFGGVPEGLSTWRVGKK